jgi:hypothetical protein
MSNYFEGIPIYNVFVMILIISANWMAALYPCRFKTLLSNNMYMRHLFGFFTMMFFVVLSNSKGIANIQSIFSISIVLYTFFIMMLRTPLMVFLSLLALLLISYILNMKKNEINDDISIDEEDKLLKIKNIEIINTATTASSCILLIFGFIVYLGQKKIEYKSKFDYITFLLGKSECINSSPRTSYISGVMHSFD